MSKQIVIIPVFIVVLLIGWMVGVYVPAHKESGLFKKRLATLEQRERQRISEDKIRMMKNVVDSLFTTLDNKMKRFYPEARLLDLGRTIQSTGKRYGLSLISVKLDYDSLALLKNNEQISELPMTMEFKGTFNQLGKFLDDMCRFPFVMRVDQVSLEKKGQRGSDLNIELQGIIVLRKERDHEITTKRKNVTNRA